VILKCRLNIYEVKEKICPGQTVLNDFKKEEKEL
jgi:hypothetical protein